MGSLSVEGVHASVLRPRLKGSPSAVLVPAIHPTHKALLSAAIVGVTLMDIDGHSPLTCSSCCAKTVYFHRSLGNKGRGNGRAPPPSSFSTSRHTRIHVGTEGHAHTHIHTYTHNCNVLPLTAFYFFSLASIKEVIKMSFERG